MPERIRTVVCLSGKERRELSDDETSRHDAKVGAINKVHSDHNVI